MNVGLWLHKPPHARILGPVADAARRRGHQIITIPTDQGATETVRRLNGNVDVVLAATPKLPDWVHKHVMPETQYRAFNATQKRGFKYGIQWVSVGYLQEELFWMLYATPGLALEWDAITTGSYDGLDFLIRKVSTLPGWGASWAESLRKKFHVTGYPTLDVIHHLDRQEVRDKLFPGFKDKRILLFLPAARPVRLPYWRRAAFWGPSLWGVSEYVPNYHRIAEAVGRYAKRHDAHVVIKTRKKNQDPGWLARIGDLHEDVSFHPATTLQLVVASDAYVGFSSATAVEATAAGLNQTHIMAWPWSVEWPDYRDFREHFYMKAGPWNRWKVSHTINAWELPWRVDEWADHALWPGRAPREDCDSALAPMCGMLDGKASDRVVDLIEGL